MKKIIMVFFLVCMVCGSVQAQDVIRIANETATPPFNFVDGKGKIQGFDVDIAAALCDVMGATKEDVIQDWDGMIPGLLAKKFDAIISDMSITAKRLRVVNFSDSYFDETGLFMALAGKKFDFSKQGLKGKKIAVQRATTFANYIKGVYGTNVEIKYYDTPAAQVLELLSGRVDLVLAGNIFAYETLKSEDGKKLAIVGEPVTDKKFIGDGIGIAVRKSDTALLARFNKALAIIRENGTYEKIYAKWFR